jgi:hypothetical protein
MASLGEFGAELDAIDEEDGELDTFLFHGHEFTVPAKVSSLPALRFAYNAKQVIAAEDQAAAAMQRARTAAERERAARLMAEVQLTANAGLYTYLRDILATPGEWERFEAVAAEFGAEEAELMDVATKIMAAVAARPTRRSSGSPAGPSTIGDGSPDDSSSPPEEEPEPEPVRSVMGRARPVVVTEQGADPEPLTDLERARDEMAGAAVSVRELVRSGG